MNLLSKFATCIAALLMPPATTAVAQAQVGATALTPFPLPKQLEFTNASASAGIDAFTYSNTDHSGGIAWIDYNNDFWPDLFMTNGLGWDHWLFRNNGDGTFTDVSTLVPKTTLAQESCASLFGDIDNDGDSDLVVVVDSPIPGNFPLGGPNLLYMNKGDGTFSEQGLVRGIHDPFGRRNTSGGIADFDRDGDLDIFFGMRAIQLFPLSHFDWYAQNDGTGAFSDATAGTGLAGFGRNAQVAFPFDVDLDGWMDLYVGNVGQVVDGYPQMDSLDNIWVNDGTGASFADLVGAGAAIGNDASAAMGATIGDIDNDGDWDLYITDNPIDGDAPFGNVLYKGDGLGGLDDNTCDEAGICTSAPTWSCNFADFDGDGWVDLYVGTLRSIDDDLVFRNDGDGTFTRSPQPAMTGNNTRGGSIADYDGDGDVDIAFWNAGQDSPLYRNDSQKNHHWLAVKLTGTTSNRDAIGALVRATTGGMTQMRRVSGGDSAHSQKELMLNFGLGDNTVLDSLEVYWPSGTVQVLVNLPVDEVLFVDESAGRVPESLTIEAATWSTSTQEMMLEVTSNFGGRTSFEVTGYGPLAWNPDSLSFADQFDGVASNPGTVTIESRRGDTFSVPLTTIP